MPRKIEFARELRSIQISEFARQFLNNFKSRGDRVEPYYQAMDRLINAFRTSETYELQEKIRGLQHANEEYLKRIHELENERQTKLTIEK